MKFSFFFKRVAFYPLSIPKSSSGSDLGIGNESPIRRSTHSDRDGVFDASLPVLSLKNTIQTLQKNLGNNFLPLGSALLSFLRAVDDGTMSRHKAILLVGFSHEEEKHITDAMKNLLGYWRDYATAQDLLVGLATDHKGTLTQITATQESQAHRSKHVQNQVARYAEVGAFFIVFLLANVFNDGRIFNPKGSLGQEYGDDTRILKHITFTQFDLLILALAPAFALIAKTWYLENWKSPIVNSPSDVPYAEIRNPNPVMLKGEGMASGALHRAHGGILWVGSQVLGDKTCRNLLRTGLTQGGYETPLGLVPNAFLMIGTIPNLGVMAGTENDGRFTVISKHTPATTLPGSIRHLSVQPQEKILPQSTFLQQLHAQKRAFLDVFQNNYLTYLDCSDGRLWRTMRSQILDWKTQSPLLFITGLDTLIDRVFVNLEQRNKAEPYYVLFSGPYGAAKTTLGQEVSRILAKEALLPENTYYALETHGARLALCRYAAPHVPDNTPLIARKVAGVVLVGLALLFASINVAVTDKYQNEKVSFQDSLDRLQFSWMLLFAWVGLVGLVLKKGYEVAHRNDNLQNVILDFSTKNTVGSTNEDLSVAQLIGKQVATTGFPHNRYAFSPALLLQHAGLFAENWDAIPDEPKQTIMASMQSRDVQLPTGDTVPIRTQFLVATTNHLSTAERNDTPFHHEEFSLIAPWHQGDDIMIVANIIHNTEPHTPHWNADALKTFLDFCRSQKSGQAVLTRQVLVDLVRDIGNLAWYVSLPSVDTATVQQVWRERVFEGPLVEIRQACRQISA